ncbi:hypothetical protein [Kitasatospora sp. LaBMicrA B282]|uniref:hypothetical protein n=1 Tax=Kitasatospora sp. LaBMicrA B282 TaxID=3420949 RepID=UPI003D0F9D94
MSASIFPSLVGAVAALSVVLRRVGAAARAKAAVQRARAEQPAAPFDPVRHGLVPTAELDAERAAAPPPALVNKERQAVADAAWEGDWRPAAAYVAAAGEDWDERWLRQELLVAVAVHDADWLTEWREDQPGNCTAATVAAQLLVHQAWEVRGAGYADEVPADRMARFRQLLPAAFEAARRAALLSPTDPGPAVVMITVARAMRRPPEEFRPLWAELTARAPQHFDGHWQGLQYWCAKWCGSHAQMLDFAADALRRAPAGSPLAGIHLHALQELEKAAGPGALPTGQEASARLLAVGEALERLPADHERLPGLRHLLAYYLLLAGLHEAALEQFRLLGPWCGAAPWLGYRDPAVAFDRARAAAARGAGR